MRNALFIPLIVPALVTLASPALSQGFNAADLGAAAQTAKASPAQQQQELDAETEKLRLAIAYDTALGISSRSPAEQTLLIGGLPTGEGGADLFIQWFMAGAIAQPGYGTRTLLYNPLARSWLMLAWTKQADGGWQLSRMMTRTAGPASWINGDGPYLGALVADYAVTRSRVDDFIIPEAGAGADKWIAGVALWMNNPLRRASAEYARQLIADGRTGPLGSSAIDSMPARARATFSPMAGLQMQDGKRSLIYGSALFPQLLIAADFDSSATPKLAQLTLINLNNAGALK